jgi:acid phosphatase class B
MIPRMFPLVLTSLLTGLACAAPTEATRPDEPSSSAAAEDALLTHDSLSIACRGATGPVNLKLLARDGAFEISAAQSGHIVFSMIHQRPSLNVRITGDARAPRQEFIDFVEAGLDAPPVDGPKALELDLYSSLPGTYSRALSFKDGATTIALACRYGSDSVLRATKLNPISDVDMRGIAAVGFDIDDTLAFTTPTFTRAFASGGSPKPDDTVFWTLANGCDLGCPAQALLLADGTEKLLPANDPSTPKSSAIALIAMHKARGHKVFAITARPDTNGSPLRAYLARELAIAEEDVYFEPDLDAPGNPKGKTDRIESLGLDLFYGDSDSDIRDTEKAFLREDGTRTKAVRSVRFLRAPTSSNRKAGKLNKYHPGYFGEPILRGSYD